MTLCSSLTALSSDGFNAQLLCSDLDLCLLRDEHQETLFTSVMVPVAVVIETELRS